MARSATGLSLDPTYTAFTMSRVLTLVLLLSACGTPFGARATGDRLERMRASPQWKDGAFTNALPRETGHLGKMLAKGFTSVEGETPAHPPPVVHARFDDERAPGLWVTWLGHSTMLLEVDGQRLLIDPVWGSASRPSTGPAPRAFTRRPCRLTSCPRSTRSSSRTTTTTTSTTRR